MQAELELSSALSNTPGGHVSNRRRILVYLIPIRLVLHQVMVSLSLSRSLARSLSLVEPAALPGLPLPTPAMEGPGGTALSLVCNIHARSGYTSM